MPKTQKEEIIYDIETQIDVETESKHTKEWTKDYKEGFIDGLKRSIEIIKNE